MVGEWEEGCSDGTASRCALIFSLADGDVVLPVSVTDNAKKIRLEPAAGAFFAAKGRRLFMIAAAALATTSRLPLPNIETLFSGGMIRLSSSSTWTEHSGAALMTDLAPRKPPLSHFLRPEWDIAEPLALAATRRALPAWDAAPVRMVLQRVPAEA